MNKLLIALLLVSSAANAEALFQLNNNAGGKIVLTDELCRNNKNRLAYSMSPNHDTILGCWSADSSYVHIGWYEGGIRSYTYEGWVDVRTTKSSM
jgi:hypothetical protein